MAKNIIKQVKKEQKIIKQEKINKNTVKNSYPKGQLFLFIFN
jgi:NOL1/NOP2/fmu family ribosome biogenesis protein